MSNHVILAVLPWKNVEYDMAR